MIRPNNPPFPGRGPKRSRSPKRGSSKKKSWCGLFLLAWVVTVLLAGYGTWWFVVGAGNLFAFGMGAVIGP